MKPVFCPYEQRGAALIAVLAAVLLFSVLAAALVPMVSTSSLQGVAGNQSAKAYLLAEAGYRYAASAFLHAGESEIDQSQAIEDLDGDYILGANDGSFNLRAFSYFYELTQPVNGELFFTAHAPGNFPGNGALPNDEGAEIVLTTGLKLRIGQETYTLTSGSAQTSDDTVTFNVNSPLGSYPAGTLVYPVADVNVTSNASINEGDPLTYEAGDAAMFPLRNGTIQINGRTLTYRFNNRNANQFEDVRAPAGQPALSNFDLTASPLIRLTRYVRLHATGIIGSGSAANQVRRQVVYHNPLPPNESSPQQEEFTDQFNPGENNWADTPGTATASRSVDGDSALTVDASAVIAPDQKGASVTFEPGSDSAAAINFSASQRGTRGYLSYDAQIKIGYESSPPPNNGFFPTDSPIPAYGGAGLTFRKDGSGNVFNNNGYKLSILRGNNDLVDPVDGIPNELLPPEIKNDRAIVLWRQTVNPSERTWLAYKRLIHPLLPGDVVTLFEEDNETIASNAFEDGSSPTDMWDLEPVAGFPGQQRSGSARNWYYGLFTSHTYDLRNPSGPPGTGIGVASSGTLTSDPITLPDDVPPIFLTFWSWHETEPGSATRSLDVYDLKQVTILGTPNMTRTIAAETLPGPDISVPPGADGWYQARIDLGVYRGKTIRIQFRFDTVDGIENNYEGWYVDDIQLIIDSTSWSADELQEATLALGLKEAMVVRFRNGSGAPISQGNRIYGARGTTGTILSPPLIESGVWADGTASGTLLLNNTTVRTTGAPFETGETLQVMGNTGEALVTSWSSANDTKANIIQVYVATKEGLGSGSGTNNPLDGNTLPYGRLDLTGTTLTELQWPPVLDNNGNWTDNGGTWDATEDYFQLIEWDAINPTATDLSFHKFTTAGQEVVHRAVLQSTDPDLITPTYPGLFEQSELGLHAIGDGSDNIYYDDFGIRLNVFETDILPTPIQR